MSEITRRIDAYVDGGRKQEDWVVLREWLAHHTYVTADRYASMGLDSVDAAQLGVYGDWGVDGTWDEVIAAWAAGKLTDEEENEITRRIEELDPDG
jgi:hypothetical protein